MMTMRDGNRLLTHVCSGFPIVVPRVRNRHDLWCWKGLAGGGGGGGELFRMDPPFSQVSRYVKN
jgi:hypothetical protein